MSSVNANSDNILSTVNKIQNLPAGTSVHGRMISKELHKQQNVSTEDDAEGFTKVVSKKGRRKIIRGNAPISEIIPLKAASKNAFAYVGNLSLTTKEEDLLSYLHTKFPEVAFSAAYTYYCEKCILQSYFG